MSSALLAVIVVLGLAGALPALAVARRSPAAVFLAPLAGAVIVAVAVELELGVGGSLLTWFVLVALVVNVAVAGWWLAAGRSRPAADGTSWPWLAVTVAVVVAALIVPLTALHTPIIGYDSNAIWLTHALMVSGGHHELLAALRNPAYLFSHPDYPPLVPSADALAFTLAGRGDLHVAVDVTALLNAAALGVAAAGVATVAARGRQLQRAVAVAAAAGVCLAGFAIASPYGVDGHADLLWAAAAVAAIVWGLVLPKSSQALGIAWICAMVASLTKNEGFTSALIVLALIAFRYRPVTLSWLRRLRERQAGASVRCRVWPFVHSWAERGLLVVVPALPGVAWAGMVRLIGLQDAFFKSASPESLSSRASATVASTSVHLVVLPFAVVVLIAGCLFARRDREHARLASPAWLWAACLLSQAIIFGTYVFGSLEIHRWLLTSVARTTIFAQAALYTELAIWLVLACGGADRAGGDQQDVSFDAEELSAETAENLAGSADRGPADRLLIQD